MTSEFDAGVATRSSGASTATDQGRRAADTARTEAQNVAETAVQQTRSVVTDAAQQVSGQVSDQAAVQRDKLSQTLRTLSDDLEQMASQGQDSGLAADLAREVSARARALGSHLEGRDPARLLDDVRDVARRRPGTFLLGALAAGVVAGRLFRATADGVAAAELEGQSGRHTSDIDTSATAPEITPFLTAEPTPERTVGAPGDLSGRPSLGMP